MPRNLSGVGSEPAPCRPQSTLPLVSCTDIISRFSTIETSPCPPGHITEDTKDGIPFSANS